MQRKTKAKICGLKNVKEASWVLESGAEYAGMVLFYPKSKRNISPEQAGEILDALGEDISKVAVVVSPTAEQIRILQTMDFDYIQIHGELQEGVMESLQIPFLKAFNGLECQEWEQYHRCEKCAGYVFDAHEPGSGKAFDWTMLKKIPRDEKLFFLAGGLNPDNVRKAIGQVHPDVVDVSSGVERNDGKGKDPDKIQAFLYQISLLEAGSSED